MRKRGLCCGPVSVGQSVLLSVRLSVSLSVGLSETLVNAIHTDEYIVKLLCRSGSPIILVF